MTFRKFYYEEEESSDSVQQGAEAMFSDVVGVEIPSLDSFLSWLILNKKIPGVIKTNAKKKPVSIRGLPDEKKVYYLVKKVPNIEELANEFKEKFGSIDK
jgi:hypothetical protein